MLTAEQYQVERAIVDKADYAACSNEMRGRVEQYELRTNPPESFVAYVSGRDITTWTGDKLGTCTFGARWRVNSHFGSTMYQIYARMAGREYTGRGFGEGMAVVLRETAASKRNRNA